MLHVFVRPHVPPKIVNNDCTILIFVVYLTNYLFSMHYKLIFLKAEFLETGRSLSSGNRKFILVCSSKTQALYISRPSSALFRSE